MSAAGQWEAASGQKIFAAAVPLALRAARGAGLAGPMRAVAARWEAAAGWLGVLAKRKIEAAARWCWVAGRWHSAAGSMNRLAARLRGLAARMGVRYRTQMWLAPLRRERKWVSR